jgi:hypothetical protein
MVFGVYSFMTDAGPVSDGHSGGDLGMTGTVSLRRDGMVVKTWPYSDTKFVVDGLPAGGSTYTFTMAADQPNSYSTLSTHVTGEWTFRSAHVDVEQNLPLLAVRFAALGLDDHNRAKPGRITPIPVTVVRNPDNQPATVAGFRVESSTDDGHSWRPVTLTRTHTGWLAAVTNPRRSGYVSLRASATDTDGNAVTETIVHAYAVG